MAGLMARSKGWIVRRLLRDERGATAIEYSLIAAGVSIAIITTVFGVGSNLQANWYDKIAAIFN
jgi:pilus assembly protein Flp/PilA